MNVLNEENSVGVNGPQDENRIAYYVVVEETDEDDRPTGARIDEYGGRLGQYEKVRKSIRCRTKAWAENRAHELALARGVEADVFDDLLP